MKIRVYNQNYEYQIHDIPTGSEIVIMPVGKFQIHAQIRYSDNLYDVLMIDNELPAKVEILS